MPPNNFEYFFLSPGPWGPGAGGLLYQSFKIIYVVFWKFVGSSAG